MRWMPVMKTVFQKPLICRQGTGPRYGRHGEGNLIFTSIEELSLIVRTGDGRHKQLFYGARVH